MSNPTPACDAARESLEMLRRYAQENGAGIVFLDSSMSDEEEALLREVWPDLVVRDHRGREEAKEGAVAPENTQ